MDINEKNQEDSDSSNNSNSPSEKQIIVAVSGYFDPIHVGHIELMQNAKALGTKLIAIINNDKQTKNKKGYVFMNQEDRKKIVESLKVVDEAFISIDDDKSVCKSITAVHPDIFGNGGDRFNYEVPETKLCKKLGIKIVDGLGKKIRSSSELIQKQKQHQIGIKETTESQ